MTMDPILLASIVSAVAAVILVVFGLPPFLRWWRERKQVPTQSVPAVAPSLPTVQVHLWNSPPVARVAATASGQGGSTQPTLGTTDAPTGRAVSEAPTSSGPPRRQLPRKPEETVLFDGTLEIEATGFAEVHERLANGTVVEGIAEEVSGQSFDFYIMDQRNYARFSEDRGGTDIYAQEDRVAFNFKKKIPRDGVWYFVFDTYSKQADREVRFEMRAIEPS